MTDKIVLRVENTISNQLEPAVRRMDQLEAAVEELTVKINDLYETGNAMANITIITNTIPVPEARGKTKTTQILDLFKEEYGELTDDERTQMLETLLKAAKLACQSVGFDEEKIDLPWKALGRGDKLTMLQLTLDEAKAADNRLQFLQRCTRLWACEYVVQPKWSSKSKYNRRERQVLACVLY
jgi:hypothetical protein